MMMFMNLIWAWGHPEVYILVLPAFGIFSEVFSTFSGKPLFGYRSMVMATLVICIVSFMVWLHHFFTMGAGADVNAVFGIATSIIAVGTGVKIYNWIFTMYGGRIRFDDADAVVARLHRDLRHRRHDRRAAGRAAGGFPAAQQHVPGRALPQRDHRRRAVRRSSPGSTYWFPKAFGFRLHEGWGKAAFWFACRRLLRHLHAALRRGPAGHDAAPAALRRRRVAALGAGRRVRHRCHGRRRRLPGRSSSWSASAIATSCATRPATRGTAARSNGRRPRRRPSFNFAVLPHVDGEEPYWGDQAARDRDAAARRRAATTSRSRCRATARPASSCAFFATVIGFALIWHIWWLAMARAASAPTRSSSCSPGATCTSTTIPAEEVARHRSRRRRAAREACSPHARGGAGMSDAAPRRRRALARPRGPVPARPSRPWREEPEATGHGEGGPARQADDRRLRLLDLPAQRHRDVLVLLRRLRGAAGRDRGRAERRETVRHAPRRRSRPPACCSRASPAGWRCRRDQRAQPALDPGLPAASPACSAWPSSCWSCANSPA